MTFHSNSPIPQFPNTAFPHGFTLLELIMSIGILGVLIGVTISNFHSGSRNEAVRQGANLAAGLLRQAQSMSQNGTATGGSFPKGGYGVRFDTASPAALTLFGDNDGDFNYDAGEEIAAERVNLPAGASFNLGSTLNIVFSPPAGAVYFNGALSPDSWAIPFQGTGTAVTRTVTVYRLSGQVRIQ